MLLSSIEVTRKLKLYVFFYLKSRTRLLERIWLLCFLIFWKIINFCLSNTVFIVDSSRYVNNLQAKELVLFALYSLFHVVHWFVPEALVSFDLLGHTEDVYWIILRNLLFFNSFLYEKFRFKGTLLNWRNKSKICCCNICNTFFVCIYLQLLIFFNCSICEFC